MFFIFWNFSCKCSFFLAVNLWNSPVQSILSATAVLCAHERVLKMVIWSLRWDHMKSWKCRRVVWESGSSEGRNVHLQLKCIFLECVKNHLVEHCSTTQHASKEVAQLTLISIPGCCSQVHPALSSLFSLFMESMSPLMPEMSVQNAWGSAFTPVCTLPFGARGWLLERLHCQEVLKI